MNDNLITLCVPIERYTGQGWPPNEVFAPIDGHPGYYASTFGRILYQPTMEIVKLFIKYAGRNGKLGKPYLYCSIRNENGKYKPVMVGRLVLKAFDPRPSYEGLECNHINLDTMNNYRWNLEWTTHRENVWDYYRNVHPESIMPDETVHKICEGLEKSWPFNKIAEYAGLEYNEQIKGYITAVRRGSLRADISRQYNFPEKRRNTAFFTNPEIRHICDLICQRYTNAEILVAMGKDFPRGSDERLNALEIIRRIRSKERFTDISDDYFMNPIIVDRYHNIMTTNKMGRDITGNAIGDSDAE